MGQKKGGGKMVPVLQIGRMSIKRVHVRQITIILSLLIMSVTCWAGDSHTIESRCAGVDQRLPGKELSSAIIRVLGGEISKQENTEQAVVEKLEKYMGKEDWHIVWATPADMERGVFILFGNTKTIEYIGAWGGVASPEEEQSVLEWFRNRAPTAPVSLLECAAYTLTHEQP
jgi:hypothetical protein